MLKTGGAGSITTTTLVDVNVDDVSILTAAISLGVGAGYSKGLASLDPTKVALAANSVLTVDVDQVPETTAPTDLSISIVLAPSEA